MIEPALALIRATHVAALAVIVGGLAFLVLVARPAFAAVGASALPAHFQRWQTRALGWALAVAAVSGAAWLAAEAVSMSGEPVAALLRGGALGTVLTHTQFGAVWQWRAAAVPPLAGYLWLRHRHGSVPLAIDAAATVLAGAWIVALGWVGHAAAMGGDAGGLHLAGHAVHLLAAATWLGGLPALAMLLIAAERAGGPRDWVLAGELTRRFSVLGLVCVAALVATGLTNALFMVDSLAALIATDYGRLLLLKIALFAAMLAMAARNRWQLAPRLRAGEAPAAGRALACSALAELALGLGVILVVGLLAVTPPAHQPAPAAHHHQQASFKESRDPGMRGIEIAYRRLWTISAATAVRGARLKAALRV